MAARTTIDCLLRAIDDLTVRGADEEELRRVKRRLKEQVKRSDQDDVALINSLQHSANMEYHTLIADRLAETGMQARMADYQGGRFEIGGDRTIAQKAEAARNLRKEVSPLSGNRGSTEEATLAALIPSEQGLLGGRLTPIIKFIADTKMTMKDSEMAPVWLKEVIGIDTGNAEAKSLAKLFHDTMFEYLNRLKKANVLVEKVENWFPQTHDWARIQSNFAEWKKFLVKHLDRDKHPDVEAAADALQHAIAKQEYAEAGPGALGVGRTFWFDTPEAQFEYQLKFGRGNVTGTVLSIIHRFGSEVAMAEKFSAKPAKLMREVARQMQDDIAATPAKTVKDKALKQRAQWDLRRAVNLVEFQQQATSTPTLADLETLATGLRETFSALYLGKVTGAIITEDVWNGVWQGRHISGGFMQSLSDRTTTFVEAVNNTGNAREVAEYFGWSQHALIANGMSNRYGLVDGPGSLGTTSNSKLDTGAAAAQQGRIFTNRYTAASMLEQSLRGMNGRANQFGLGKLVKKDWDQIGDKLRRLVLESNGITSKDWEVFQKIGSDADGRSIDLGKLRQQNPKLFYKTAAMLTRESHLQTILPDMETRFLLGGAIPPGATREAAKIMTQFLSFPLTIWRNSIARDLRAGVPSFMIGASGYVVARAFTTQLYALAGGGVAAMFQWDSPTLWRRALLSSAVMGPLLPMVFEGLDKGEFELPGIVPARIVGTGAQLKDAGVSWMDGETDKAAADAIKVASSFVPNWWFIDYVTNSIVDSVVEDLDPQAARARKRRLKREQRIGER